MSEKIPVPENKEFVFENECPHCDGDLIVWFEGWTESDDGEWEGEHCMMTCSNEPDIENDFENFKRWEYIHLSEPYIDWHPKAEQLKKYINKHYKFELE